MNKRITSLMLCFVMVFAMLATAVPALAAPIESTQLKVTADKTSAKPGDTITFTITLGPVSDMGSMQMDLVIPEGLTYVANSGKLADGLMATLGFDAADWTEVTKRINGGASAADYSCDGDTVLAKFQCTVNDDATSGNYQVGLDNLEFYSCQTWTDHTGRFSVVPATVTVSIPHVHTYDKEVATEAHLKSAATCTSAAVYYKSCECGANGTATFTSGAALGHDYTEQLEDNAHLKTAASNCTEHNEYWYDCSRCDANAKNDPAAADKHFTSVQAGPHIFTEKIEDEAHYVAGTGTNCQSVKQYYYDCAYCNQMGTDTWNSTTYGPHDHADTWTSDKTGHWHACQNSGCTDKADFAAHTPDHEGHATEEYAIKCTECGYVIEAQLTHTHKLTKVTANAATCTTAGNKEYYVCACGMWFADADGKVEITDHSSVVIGASGHDWKDATCTEAKTCNNCGETEGIALDHDYAKVWSSDEHTHWHECTRCHDKADEAEHTPDREEATETEPIKCTECGYVIAEALGMADYVLDMPVSVQVNLIGDEEPGKEVFKLEIFDLGNANTKYVILNDTLTAEDLEFVDGVAYFHGSLKIQVTGLEQLGNLTEGFCVRMVKGTSAGWTYATEEWNIMPIVVESFDTGEPYIAYDVREIIDGEVTDSYANGMSFTVSYEAVDEPIVTPPEETPDEPETPKTGDAGMTGLWIALLLVSGAGAIVISRKKRSVR